MTDAIRLSKYLTHHFTCSRREADLLIEGGWVTVDGVVVEEPQFKVLDQHIEIHPDAVAEPLEPATLLFHKPAGIDTGSLEMLTLISLASRTPDDPARIRPLKKHFSRLKALLPLEIDACGLQVLTQDYRVERKLGEECDRIEQEWIVEVTGRIIDAGLSLLNEGPTDNGRSLPRAKGSWQKVSRQNETRLRFAIKNPQPGQIVHACASVGLTVQSMKRIRIGRIPLSGLPAGQWRYVPPYERF